MVLIWAGNGAHRERERVCNLQRGANIKAQQLSGDEVRRALLAVLDELENDVALQLHRPQPAVLCLRDVEASK